MEESNAFAGLRGHRYMSLASFRRDGARVLTPVWFAADSGKLYVMTRGDSGKMKRIRRQPRIEVAPCTALGRVLGPFVPALAHMAPDQNSARRHIRKKYVLARIPLVWRRNIYVEIVPTSG